MSQISPPTSDSKELSLVSLLLSETDSSRMPSFGTCAIERTKATPKLNDIYGVVRRFNLDLLRSYERVQQSERATVGFTISDEPDTTSLTKTAEACLAHLVRRAEEEFAPAGGTLNISKSNEMDEAGISGFEERWRDKTHRQDFTSECPGNQRTICRPTPKIMNSGQHLSWCDAFHLIESVLPSRSRVWVTIYRRINEQ